jgi:hypothetical protein
MNKTNKYFEIAKKTTIEYKEKRIDAEDFKKKFEKLDKFEVYKNLEKDDYVGISNYISEVAELDDQSTLESQTIVNIIDLFYCFFIDNYDYIYSKDFYKFLKIGLSKENKNPVRFSFKEALKNYFYKKISDYCLAYIASEFINNLKFFEKEIKEDKELFRMLTTALKLKPTKLLEDLTPEEQRNKNNIDNILREYI